MCVDTISYYGKFSEGQDGYYALKILNEFIEKLEEFEVIPYIEVIKILLEWEKKEEKKKKKDKGYLLDGLNSCIENH